MIWKNRKEKIKQNNFENFDDFLFGEIYDFLDRVQPLANSDNTTANVLAAIDSMLIGMRHASFGENYGESCPCCKYWCAGTKCPLIQEAWDLFLQTLPEIKSLINHA